MFMPLLIAVPPPSNMQGCLPRHSLTTSAVLPSVPNRRTTNVCDAGDMLHRSVPVATSDQRMHIMAVSGNLAAQQPRWRAAPATLVHNQAADRPLPLMHTLSISGLLLPHDMAQLCHKQQPSAQESRWTVLLHCNHTLQAERKFYAEPSKGGNPWQWLNGSMAITSPMTSVTTNGKCPTDLQHGALCQRKGRRTRNYTIARDVYCRWF